MQSRLRLFDIAALTLILLLAAGLRFAGVAANPGWYTDEGTHINIANNLLLGHIQYFAIKQSTLLFARLPLFEILLAAVFRLFHPGIDTLRALTGTLGVVSVGWLYIVMRRIGDRWLALLAALLLAIYPPAILYSRFGFSYNLLTPLLLIAYLGLGQYLDRSARRLRPLLIASLAIGLGAISDLWMLSVIVPVLMVIAVRNWRHVPLSLALMLLPFGLYTLISLLSTPAAFWFDLRFTVLRLGSGSLVDQLGNVLNNFKVLIAQDSWLVLGLVGLICLRPARVRWLALMLFGVPLMLVGRSVVLYSLSYYYLIPSLPLVAIGLSALLRFGLPWLINIFIPGQSVLVHRLVFGVAILVVALPFMSSTLTVIDQIQSSFRTDIAPFLIDPPAAQIASAFVNQNIAANELVVASPGVAWLLKANAADFQMSIAAAGIATPHLPADIPIDRYAFNPAYTLARFVIVDNLWRNWGVPNVAGLADMLQRIEAWPLALKSGSIEVYRNPELP